MPNSIEWNLATYMRNGIASGLSVDPSQTSISAVKLHSPDWLGWPHYQVVPGNVRPDGGGRGSQEGGTLIRIQRMTVYVFVKLELDQYQFSSQQLLNESVGMFNQFEALRN